MQDKWYAVEDKLNECSWSNSSIRFGFKPQYVGGELLHGAAIFEVMAIGKAAHALQPNYWAKLCSRIQNKSSKVKQQKYLSVKIILFKNQ